MNQNCKTGNNGSTRSIYANFKSQAKVKTVEVSTYTTYNGSCLMKSVSFLVRTDYLLKALKGHINHTDFIKMSLIHILTFMIKLIIEKLLRSK